MSYISVGIFLKETSDIYSSIGAAAHKIISLAPQLYASKNPFSKGDDISAPRMSIAFCTVLGLTTSFTPRLSA